MSAVRMREEREGGTRTTRRSLFPSANLDEALEQGGSWIVAHLRSAGDWRFRCVRAPHASTIYSLSYAAPGIGVA
jgi:hypothetical protein